MLIELGRKLAGFDEMPNQREHDPAPCGAPIRFHLFAHSTTRKETTTMNATNIAAACVAALVTFFVLLPAAECLMHLASLLNSI